jgi:hypothetical protein
MADAGGLLTGCPSMERRFCCSKVKHPLEAKAYRTVPPMAVRGEVLLHCAICLTLWVSK